jgi:prepilin-type N-terminal cleavage/methylation domain-containing protein
MSVKHSSQQGFSLIELLVSLGIIALFFLAMVGVIDRSARMNKVENAVSDAQQNVRFASFQMVKNIRMARVGNLTYVNSIIPAYNNAPTGTTISSAGGRSHPVRAGTDAIEVRGILSSPMFAIDTSSLSASPTTGVVQVTILPVTPGGVFNNQILNPCFSKDVNGVCQANGPDSFHDFMVALNALDSGYVVLPPGGNWTSGNCVPYAVSDANGVYDVGTVQAVSVIPTTPPGLKVTLNFADPCAQTYNLAGGPPRALNSPSDAGILDDIVYFVHDGAECSEGGAGCPAPIPDPTKSHPFLATASRLVALGGAASTFNVLPLAENIEDMQIAYGIDAYTGTTLPLSTVGSDGIVYPLENVNGSGVVVAGGDEWYPNASGDGITVPGSPPFSPGSVPDWLDGSQAVNLGKLFQYTPVGTTEPVPLLKAVKIALVAIGDRPDTQDGGYKGPGSLGFNVMDSTAAPVSPRMPYHRRMIDLSVSLRNYGI